MADSYVSLIEKRARQQLEDLNTAQQRAVIEAYNSAGKELVRRYRNAKDGTATKAMLASYAKKIAEETEELIKQYAIKGAEVAPSVQKLIMNQAFQMAGLDTSVANDKFNNIIGTLGKESVKNVIGGKIYKDGAGLSDRIWQASAQSSNKIQEVITASLAQDMGASEMSKILQAYVNPTARKTWSREKIREKLGPGYAAWNGNLEYNALRLARTTLAHTATMSMRQSQKLNPYASKIQWHSVHAGDRTCQICIDMDGNIYDTDKCPFNHPNGMCYQTTVLEKPLDEIAKELADWAKGGENEMLDNWWKSIGGTDDKPKPKSVSTPTKVNKTISKTELVDSLQQFFRRMNAGHRGFTQSAYDEFIDGLMSCSEDYKRLWMKYAGDIASHHSEGGDTAYYSRYGRRLCISIPSEMKQATAHGCNKFSVLCHEMGHHFDNMTIYGKGSGQGYSSECKEFISAMLKDKEAILKMDKKEVSEDMWRDHNSKGVQDALGGLEIGRYTWGHSEKYWNQNGPEGRNAMTAIELFANISAACYSPQEMKYMNKYFPEAVKVFQKIITETV